MSTIQESEESKQWVSTFDVATDLAGEYFIRVASAQFPILNVPVIKQVFGFMIKNILARIDKEGELLIKFHFIDQEAGERRDAYNEEIKKLKELQQNGVSDEERKIALEAARNRMRNLIRFPVK